MMIVMVIMTMTMTMTMMIMAMTDAHAVNAVVNIAAAFAMNAAIV
jgi:hypothetical protein